MSSAPKIRSFTALLPPPTVTSQLDGRVHLINAAVSGTAPVVTEGESIPGMVLSQLSAVQRGMLCAVANRTSAKVVGN